MRRFSVALSIVVLLFVTGVAEAGFVNGSIGVDFPGGQQGKPPWAGDGGPPQFVFQRIAGLPAEPQGLLGLQEQFGGAEPLSLYIDGETNEDPIMTINKEVENDSGFTWTRFELSLPDGDTNTFVGTPTSDLMTLTSMTDYLIVFEDAVDHGQTVTFGFDVLIPSTGPFNFTLTQTPVPEPSTFVLLCLGGMGALAFRRRR